MKVRILFELRELVVAQLLEALAQCFNVQFVAGDGW